MRMALHEALGYIAERAERFDACPSPFGRAAWWSHFIEHVPDPASRIVAPGCSTLLLIEDGPLLRSLANYYTGLYAVPSDAAAILPALKRTPAVDLAPLDGEAVETAALAASLREAGWVVRPYAAAANWHLPCAGMRFDAYLAARPSQLRNTIARKHRSYPGTLRIATEPRDVDRAMDAYDAVYANSWKPAEAYPGFVRDWARVCARRGWLRLGVASVDGTPVAAHFWFVVDRVAYIFKLAYDQSFAKLSAGTLLMAAMMRRVLETDLVRAVDFLNGDDRYKRAWMTHRRQRIGLLACNPRTVAGAALAVREAARDVARRVRARGVGTMGVTGGEGRIRTDGTV